MIKKACLILGISIFSSLAFGEKCKEDLCSNRTEKDAVKILKQYSKLIACNVEDKYKAIKLEDNLSIVMSDGAFLVLWGGQLRCPGGNFGSHSSNLTRVGINTADELFVQSDIKHNLDIRIIENIYRKGGIIFIIGLAYNQGDSDNFPTKKVLYKTKLVDDKLVLVK